MRISAITILIPLVVCCKTFKAGIDYIYTDKVVYLIKAALNELEGSSIKPSDKASVFVSSRKPATSAMALLFLQAMP